MCTCCYIVAQVSDVLKAPLSKATRDGCVQKCGQYSGRALRFCDLHRDR